MRCLLVLCVFLVILGMCTQAMSQSGKWFIVVCDGVQACKPFTIKGRPPWPYDTQTGCMVDMVQHVPLVPSTTRLMCWTPR